MSIGRMRRMDVVGETMPNSSSSFLAVQINFRDETEFQARPAAPVTPVAAYFAPEASSLDSTTEKR